MLESAKRCFYSLSEIIGKEVFLKLCNDYIESNIKKKDSIRELTKSSETFYHPSIIYEWNTGIDNIIYKN